MNFLIFLEFSYDLNKAFCNMKTAAVAKLVERVMALKEDSAFNMYLIQPPIVAFKVVAGLRVCKPVSFRGMQILLPLDKSRPAVSPCSPVFKH